MLQNKLGLLLMLSAIGGSCGSTPTAPENSATNIVAIGPEVLRLTFQAPCAQLGQGVIPLIYARVNVATSSSEWVATAGSAAAGDVQIRFRQSGQSVMSGSIPITGTITGTAIHMPELFSGPTLNVRATFGGPASLDGVAFVAGMFGATTSGISGTGDGSLTLRDAMGNACSGTAFSWSIFPPP